MDSARQAAELLCQYIEPGHTLLDAGCGSGYFFHSLRDRNLDVKYIGVDAAPSLVEIGRAILSDYGLNSSALVNARIEDLVGHADHVVCINVLSNIDNYHRPLERLLKIARKTVVLRESLDDAHSGYTYVQDRFLDEGVDLKVHVNTYPLTEVRAFIESYGFDVETVVDRRTGGRVEHVIGYPHYWKFLVARRR